MDSSECKFHSLKFCNFCQKIYGREGGQHDQHFGKNKFVKNRVGGRAVNINSNNVFKYTGFFFREYPLAHSPNPNSPQNYHDSFIPHFPAK